MNLIPRTVYKRPLSTISLYVLLAVADEPRHGYGIIKDIERRTDGLLSLEAGTLYAALKRLQDEGLLRAEPAGRDPVDSRRRNYRLTPLGRRTLEAECVRLAEFLVDARVKGVMPAGRR